MNEYLLVAWELYSWQRVRVTARSCNNCSYSFAAFTRTPGLGELFAKPDSAYRRHVDLVEHVGNFEVDVNDDEETRAVNAESTLQLDATSLDFLG
jgi:hypothetical protein